VREARAGISRAGCGLAALAFPLAKILPIVRRTHGLLPVTQTIGPSSTFPRGANRPEIIQAMARGTKRPAGTGCRPRRAGREDAVGRGSSRRRRCACECAARNRAIWLRLRGREQGLRRNGAIASKPARSWVRLSRHPQNGRCRRVDQAPSWERKARAPKPSEARSAPGGRG